jgi:hypothetical protein
MGWQLAITALLVAGCTVYAVWSLLPAGWKRRLAARYRGLPAGGSGCGGCEGCAGPDSGTAAPTEQVVRIVRPPPR